jgi:hypothetical protein
MEIQKRVWKHRSTDFSDREKHMTQKAALELREDVVGEHYSGECFSFPSAGLNCHFDSLLAENAADSETVVPISAGLFRGRGKSARTTRSEVRVHLSTSLWLTSLQKPGVFEIVPTLNVSRLGIQLVTQKFWEPAERVLVSSPPGVCVQGSIVYCMKLPSDDHILGIGLDAPVQHWIERLGLGGG